MITEIHKSDVPALGTPIGGGFAVATYRDGDKEYLLVVAGKEGELKGVWGEYGKRIDSARSVVDGLANTAALAAAGSKLAASILALSIGGATDWHIPARDQLELLYRHLKPTAEENFCSFRDGENPSALPVATFAYTEESPAQTAVEAFQQGGEHALEPLWYWSSTQSSASDAWGQNFGGGSQGHYHKRDELACRLVRRILVIQ